MRGTSKVAIIFGLIAGCAMGADTFRSESYRYQVRIPRHGLPGKMQEGSRGFEISLIGGKGTILAFAQYPIDPASNDSLPDLVKFALGTTCGSAEPEIRIQSAVTVGGITGKRLVGSCLLNDRLEFDVRCVVRNIGKDKILYQFVLKASEEAFRRYRKEFAIMVRSVRFN